VPLVHSHTSDQEGHSLDRIKEQRALRTETTINDPLDFQRTKALETLPQLRRIGQQINAKLLDVERLAEGTLPRPSLFERLQLPTASPTGQRISPLRFGDPRVHALFEALCRFSLLPDSFRNRDLRPLVAGLLGRTLASYTAGAMTYDLRRLRLHGIVQRAPGTQRYTLTAAGAQATFFYTTLHRRLRQLPVPDELQSAAPTPLNTALRQLDSALCQLWNSVGDAA
jgi:hypothetical protein